LAGWAQVTLGCPWPAQPQLAEGHKRIARDPHFWIRRPICAALVSLSIGWRVGDKPREGICAQCERP